MRAATITETRTSAWEEDRVEKVLQNKRVLEKALEITKPMDIKWQSRQWHLKGMDASVSTTHLGRLALEEYPW
jgi:hypothetical protein